MIYQMAPVFIPIIWNKRFLAASAVKRLSLEIATPAGQSIQSLALVMQNAKIATVKTSVLTVGKTPSPFPCGLHNADRAKPGAQGRKYRAYFYPPCLPLKALCGGFLNRPARKGSSFRQRESTESKWRYRTTSGADFGTSG